MPRDTVRSSHLAVWVVAGALAGSAAPVLAQSSRPSHTDPQAATLARAWSAYQESRTGDALRLVEAVLSAHPRDHDAIALKIRLLSATDSQGALAAYEQWASGRREQDGYLLHPVAERVLWDLVPSNVPGVRGQALDALAADGSIEAKQALEASPDSPASLGSKAALGDQAAFDKLVTLARDPRVSDKTGIITQLGDSGRSEAVPVLRTFLQDPNDVHRALAAQQLAKLGDRDAISDLRRLAQPDQPVLVRGAAAAAISDLGDSSADAILQQMLASPAPDVRVMAAEALAKRGQTNWIEALQPALDGINPLARVQAAALLVKYDPDPPAAARQILASGLSDPNAVIEEAAARATIAAHPHDVRALGQLLASANAKVRLLAAKVLLGWGEPS